MALHCFVWVENNCLVKICSDQIENIKLECDFQQHLFLYFVHATSIPGKFKLTIRNIEEPFWSNYQIQVTFQSLF